MALDSLLTEWSRLLFGTFARSGVTDVVLSPGSRSTPFIVAAARTHGLRCHDVVDERAAGFVALGQARWSGRPSVLLSTSGTAGAHYFPAIIEAAHAGIPMLVVTADRPLELQACDAPQTIDQIKMFGSYVRHFFELGSPSDEALASVARIALQATSRSIWPEAGPVHLNVRARKPLEPRDASSPEEIALARRVDDLLAATPPLPRRPLSSPNPIAIAEVAEMCARSRAGVIVAGPSPIHAADARNAVVELSERTGFPLLSEAASQLRLFEGKAHVCDAFGWLYGSASFRKTSAPDLVLRIGGTPSSRGWDQLFESLRGPQVVIAPNGWSDPNNMTPHFLHGELRQVLEALCGALPARSENDGWRARMHEANEIAWRIVDREIEADVQPFSEGAAVRTVVGALPPGSVLALGNSLSIRHVDAYARRSVADVHVLSQRGANGIDGLVAGAVGSASMHDRVTTMILGDLSLFHDLTSLKLAHGSRQPFVIVVVNNRGGRIFEILPLAAATNVGQDILRHVLTPHEMDFSHATKLFGLDYRRAESTRSLASALVDAYARPGATLIECIVPEHGAAELERRIARALEGELRQLDTDSS